MRPPRVVPAREQLESLYVDSNLPVKIVAEKLGLRSLGLVYYYVHKYGLTRRTPDVPVKQMEETEKAWLAAAVDGEGTISLRPNRSRWACPLVEVSNTDVEFVRHCAIITGINCVRIKTQATEKHRACWQWRIRRANYVVSVLLQIEPYLIIKRRRARAILEYIAARRAERYGQVELLVKEIGYTNKKGPPS